MNRTADVPVQLADVVLTTVSVEEPELAIVPGSIRPGRASKVLYADWLGWGLLWVTALVGGSVFAGGVLGVRWLADPLSQQQPVKINSGLALLAFSVLMIAVRSRLRSRTYTVAVHLVGLVIAVWAAATIAEHLFDVSFGVDELFGRDRWATAALAPGRAAPQAAFALFCLGGSLAVPSRWWTARDGLTVVAIFTGLLGLVGHLFQANTLIAIPGTYGMPLVVSIAVLVAGIGAVVSSPAHQTRLFRLVSPTPGGTLLRRLIPTAVLIASVLVGVHRSLEVLGIADHRAASWIATTLAFAVVVFASWRLAATIDALTQRESDEHGRLQALVAALPDDVRTLDRDGRWERVLHRAEFAADRATSQMMLDAAVESLRTGDRGRMLTTTDGYLQLTNSPLKDATGRVTGALTVTRDITEVHAAQQRYRDLLDSIPEGAYETTIDGRFLVVNDPLARILGYHDADAFLDAITRAQDVLVRPEDRDQLVERIASGETSGALDVAMRRSDGTVITVILSYRAVTSSDGAIVSLRGTIRDVTADRETASRLTEVQERYQLAFASGTLGRVIVDVAGPTPRFVEANQAYADLLGYQITELLATDPRALVHPDDSGMEEAALIRCVRGETETVAFDTRRRDRHGEWIPVHLSGALIRTEDGTPRYAMATVEDIRARLKAELELRQLQDTTAALALHDPLTGLANRRLLIELLDADLARTERRGLPLAVAFLDLDGFKNVNDTYGHDVGDLVLCETARRLLTVVRGADTVARIGGDEFVIVYEPSETNSHNLALRVDRSLSEPINITPTIAVSCPASIGIADTGAVGYNGVALLAAADKAMYDVKRARQTVQDAQQELHRTKADLRP
jgi:diguanylate cyclase (GGDEF)-like protein/PAS domain S-box-containing protein